MLSTNAQPAEAGDLQQSNDASAQSLSQRLAMVDGQLRPNQVNDDRVLNAFMSVAREAFVPTALKNAAYADEDIRLRNGRVLIEPRVLGRMIQAIPVSCLDDCLVVACGAGYSTAVLSCLAASVVGIDSREIVEGTIADVLNNTGYEAIALKASDDLAAGDPELAPFSCIFIDGGIAAAPASLLAQLADGGVLLCVEMNGHVGKAVMYHAVSGAYDRQELFYASVPMIPELKPASEFQL